MPKEFSVSQATPETKFPAREKIESLIPSGRLGYVRLGRDLTQIAMMSDRRSFPPSPLMRRPLEGSLVQRRAEAIKTAITNIAKLDLQGELIPPLSASLSETLQQAAQANILETERDNDEYGYARGYMGTLIKENHTSEALLLLHVVHDFGGTPSTT